MPFSVVNYTLGTGLNSCIADAKVLSRNLPIVIANTNKSPLRVPTSTCQEFETILKTFLYPLATNNANSLLGVEKRIFEQGYSVDLRQRFGQSMTTQWVPTIGRWATIYQDWRNNLPANLSGVSSNQRSNLLNSLDQLYTGKIFPIVQTSVINVPQGRR